MSLISFYEYCFLNKRLLAFIHLLMLQVWSVAPFTATTGITILAVCIVLIVAVGFVELVPDGYVSGSARKKITAGAELLKPVLWLPH